MCEVLLYIRLREEAKYWKVVCALSTVLASDLSLAALVSYLAENTLLVFYYIVGDSLEFHGISAAVHHHWL